MVTTCGSASGIVEGLVGVATAGDDTLGRFVLTADGLCELGRLLLMACD